MKRVFAVYFVVLFAIAAIVAAGVQSWLAGKTDQRAATIASLPSPKGWTQANWPFLNDQFGKGKAFDCKAADCGADVSVTFRAKIGFCNCATGVSDDEELERMGDVEMIGPKFVALADGKVIKVGHMNGRSRPYAIETGETKKQILSIAFNDRCDVIVATAHAPVALPLTIEAKVLDFLNSRYVLRWAEVTLGL